MNVVNISIVGQPNNAQPMQFAKNTIMVSRTLTYNKGKARKRNYLRGIRYTDLTTDMFPYIGYNGDGLKSLVQIQLIDAVYYDQSGTPFPYNPPTVTNTQNIGNVELCKSYYDPLFNEYYYSTLNIGDYITVDHLLPDSIIKQPEQEHILVHSTEYWEYPIELRFKYFYSDGSNSGIDYASIYVIYTTTNKDVYLEMNQLPVTFECGRDMITPITYNMIIQKFNNEMVSNGVVSNNISQLINNSFISPSFIFQHFGTNLNIYHLNFLHKVFILNPNDVSLTDGSIENNRLTYCGEPIYHGQGLDFRLLKNGSLTFNGFGLNELYQLDLMFGLEALMYGSIFFSHNDSDSI